MNNINALCSDDSNNLFPKYLGEFVANPFLPRCIEEGEAPPQKGFTVPYEWQEPKPYISKRGKKGMNLLDFELAQARCRSTPKKKLGYKGLGGTLFGMVIAKKISLYFPGKTCFLLGRKA